MKVIFAIVLTAVSLSATAYFADTSPDRPQQTVNATTISQG
ncbi:MAG: hypothetical protein ACPGFA_10840 [Pikeienuella sp.]